MLWTRKVHQRMRLGPALVGLIAFAMSGTVVRAQAVTEENASPEEKRAVLLLQRATYGPRPGDFASILEMGTDRWLNEQLRPQRIDDRALAQKLTRLSDLELSTTELMQKYPRPSRAEREAMQQTRDELEKRRVEAEASGKQPDVRDLHSRMTANGENRPGRILLMMSEAKLLRAVESERQLQEVMTDFWFNHFNVYARKNLSTLIHLPSYERDAIRPHALGHFYDLLLATAQHPAMLRYLDNWINTKEGFDPRVAFREEMMRRSPQFGRRGRDPRRTPDRKQDPQQRTFGLNENYARELLELHSLGVDGGYGQEDVVEVARALTGWSTINPELQMEQVMERARRRRSGEREQEAPRMPAEDGRFHFNELAHDEGTKSVLGKEIRSGGIEDGLTVIRMLSTHPSTARFISTKLAKRFVSDHPSDELIEEMVATFQKTDGDIREVLATLFLSPRFVEEGYETAKVKTPLELVASTLRATSAEVKGPALTRAMNDLGMPLYMCQPPTGYDEESATWLSAGNVLNRIRFVGGYLASAYRGSGPAIPPEDIDSWTREVLPLRDSRISSSEKATLEEALAQYADLSRSESLQAMALVLTSPAFQRQ